MIKNIITIGIILSTVVVIFLSLSSTQSTITVVKDNHTHQAIPITPNKYNDTQCAMTIASTKYACEVVSKEDGKTWFFDDPGCMILWLQNKENQDQFIQWVYTLDTSKWIDATKAWYSKRDHTPMEYGFGAYENKQKDFIDFKTMQLKMYRGETLQNPKIKNILLGK